MKKFVVLTLLIMLAGCKKYPEDTNILHLLSVKNRLYRVWCFKTDAGHCNGELEIKSNGYFGGYWPFLSIPDQKNTWKLIDNNNKLRFTRTSNNATYEYTITRLEYIDKTWYLSLKNDTTFNFTEQVWD